MKSLKTLGLTSMAAALFLTLGIAQQNGKQQTFNGQIMDSTCAANGNHDAGYKITGTHTPKDCTLACVKSGATFVLYDQGQKKTYKLDNQTEPRSYAGQNVKVEGTLDPATETIHVAKIERAE